MADESKHARRWMPALLLITLLALAACGGAETPEPEIPPTPTLIPTLAPPATVQPVATAEATAAATEAPTRAPTTEVEQPAATEQAVGADEVEPSEEPVVEEPVVEEPVVEEPAAEASPDVTATEAVTASDEVTAGEEVTVTEEVTAAATMTAGHAMTGTASMTGTEGMTATGAVSGSSGVSATGIMTEAADASIFFLQPTSNAIVPVTFTVAVSYTGISVIAGHDHATPGAGHLHLLVDSPFIEPGQPVPSDEMHIHLADASTTTELSLSPGSHTLRLQFADSTHLALEGEQYRHEIVVNVVEGAPEARVRIASPSAGATVPPTFTVVMAAAGLDMEPAGVARPGAGHFHLLLDEPFVAPGDIIPTDATHLHFDQAQTRTEVTLTPGAHLIRLQFADGTHRALQGQQYRAEVEVLVEEGAPAERVMFIKPADGATVTSPFLVAWAASGLIIEPAGAVLRPEGGHLLIIIDEDFIPGGEPIPTDATHLHFGGGQTSAELTLEPGEHTLRLQMANGAHIAQEGAQYQDEITVTVR